MAFATAAIVAAGVTVAGGVGKLIMGGKAKREARKEKAKAEAEMRKRRQEYENLDTSNIYADVKNKYANIQTEFENVYEDMTVNQQQAQFEKQMQQQQQANIMQGLKGAAGGSGVAALAQAMANQGQLGAQRISASIGAQEAAQQMAKAQGAAGVQQMERAAEMQIAAGEQQAEAARLQGAETARGLEYQKTGTLLGMSQQEVAAAKQAEAQAMAMQMEGIGDIASGVTQGVTQGMEAKSLAKKKLASQPFDTSALAAKTTKTYKMDPTQLANRPIVTQDPSAGGFNLTTKPGYKFNF
tara:strand:+ start:97 stop:990 length:894 start_codon:yes stop_codon:yes gene_type:complete